MTSGPPKDMMKSLSWHFYLKHKFHLEALAWFSMAILDSLINAVSVVDDHQRSGLSTLIWEPYVWETSSQLSFFLLLPFLLWFDKRCSLNSSRLGQRVGTHLLFSLVFSFCHIVLMVGMRKLAYSVNGLSYDFGHWPSELVYEYRKDLITYIGLLATIYSYRFISSRLIGEANQLQTSEQDLSPKQELLIKKLGREFIILPEEIEWVEAAGNYMNLHIKGQSYPYRSSMQALTSEPGMERLIRVHRSFLINIELIHNVQYINSGDGEITLTTGDRIKLSRRYKTAFKQAWLESKPSNTDPNIEGV